MEVAVNKVKELFWSDTLKISHLETSEKTQLCQHAKTIVMGNIFSDRFQIGFKSYRNLKELFCHSKIYDIVEPRRNETRGVTRVSTKCHKCIACTRSKDIFPIHDIITMYKDVNVIYVIECSKCPNRPQYMGKSTTCLMTRGREHLASVDNGKYLRQSILFREWVHAPAFYREQSQI